MKMQKILIVEDDEKLREELEIFLNKNGYKAETLKKFNNTIRDILDIQPDLVLLDVNLPFADGEYICREIRRQSTMPIIIITSRDNELDELLCLNYGADHYVTKPFNIQILLAKIGSLLRRTNMLEENSEKIDAEDFILNMSKSTIEKGEKIIELTKNEYKIIKYLLKNRGKIVSRDEIMRYLWDDESFIDDNTLTVNITRLRNKLEELNLKELLVTKRGQGYILLWCFWGRSKKTSLSKLKMCPKMDKMSKRKRPQWTEGEEMKFKDFIKDKLPTIFLLLFGLITIEIFLMIYSFGTWIKFYIPIVIFVLYFIGILIEYFIKRSYYFKFEDTLKELEDKYLITEIIKRPNFLEGKILYDNLVQINKSMLENVNKYKYLQEDYKEYIELWIHEIKLPIATSKMIIENNKSPIMNNIDEELDKVENYVEQALFYARSNTVEKDYYIKKIILKDIVNESIKKNKNALIAERVSIDLHDLDISVNTDSKWIIFILNQIIQNSVKYRKNDDSLKIEMYSKKQKENITLYIKDNGIGMKNNELERVFEKGFTGTNGRTSNKKSTGIGLYLCKKLCDKLGIAINVNSEEGVGTVVSLIFPKGSFIDMN